MTINYKDRDSNPIQFIWGNMAIWNHEPIQADKEALKPITDNDVMRLRYAAMVLLAGNDDPTDNLIATMEEVEEEAAICDDRLYLGNFEGYMLADGYRLDNLYLNIYDRICANVYDADNNTDTYWVIC